MKRSEWAVRMQVEDEPEQVELVSLDMVELRRLVGSGRRLDHHTTDAAEGWR